MQDKDKTRLEVLCNDLKYIKDDIREIKDKLDKFYSEISKMDTRISKVEQAQDGLIKTAIIVVGFISSIISFIFNRLKL